MFNLQSKWLKKTPKDDVFLKNYKVGQNIHLRHLIQMGVVIEIQGKDFYDKLAERATDPEVKDLCGQIAKDEITHKEYLQGILFRWLTLPINEESLALFDKEMLVRGIFRNPPPQGSSAADMVKYAIEQENKMADYFRCFESAFPEAWKKMHVQDLVKQEQDHANKLMNYLPNLT